MNNWREEVTREELLEANDTQYNAIVKLEQSVENLKRENGIIDDAATYWKDNFVDLFNDIYDAVSLDSDDYTDGEVLDIIIDKVLKKYNGETDEQKEITW